MPMWCGFGIVQSTDLGAQLDTNLPVPFFQTDSNKCLSIITLYEEKENGVPPIQLSVFLLREFVVARMPGKAIRCDGNLSAVTVNTQIPMANTSPWSARMRDMVLIEAYQVA